MLVCTPTLELGVNIGDLEGVAMRNVPPSPANYAQRAGRTGRETRTGIIAGFARGTPHDGYFFDHPDEVITGAIPPPRFNLDNLAALERHVNSLVLEEAALEYANNLEPMLTDRGGLIESNVGDLIRRVEQARPAQAHKDKIGETVLRPLCAEIDWDLQRRAWSQVTRARRNGKYAKCLVMVLASPGLVPLEALLLERAKTQWLRELANPATRLHV